MSSFPSRAGEKRSMVDDVDGPASKKPMMFSDFGATSNLGFAGFSPNKGGMGASCLRVGGARLDHDVTMRSIRDQLEQMVPPRDAGSQSASEVIDTCNNDMLKCMFGYMVASKRISQERAEVKGKCEELHDMLQRERDASKLAKEDWGGQMALLQEQLADCQKEKMLLAEQVGKLEVDVTQLQSVLETSVQSRRDHVKGLSKLVKGVLSHPDVAGAITRFNKETLAYGTYRTAAKIKERYPDVVLPALDPDSRERMIQANDIFMKQDFPILEKLTESEDASIEDLMALLHV